MSQLDPYAVQSFEDFWPHYVRLHQRSQTHFFHALATSSSAALIAAAVWRRQPLFLVLAPLANHLIAQTSHRLFEQNQSTPWKNTAWHTRAELRMLSLVLTGRMAAEVRRHAEPLAHAR
jgi:hypothetical protein